MLSITKFHAGLADFQDVQHDVKIAFTVAAVKLECNTSLARVQAANR